MSAKDIQPSDSAKDRSKTEPTEGTENSEKEDKAVTEEDKVTKNEKSDTSEQTDPNDDVESEETPQATSKLLWTLCEHLQKFLDGNARTTAVKAKNRLCFGSKIGNYAPSI